MILYFLLPLFLIECKPKSQAHYRNDTNDDITDDKNEGDDNADQDDSNQNSKTSAKAINQLKDKYKDAVNSLYTKMQAVNTAATANVKGLDIDSLHNYVDFKSLYLDPKGYVDDIGTPATTNIFNSPSFTGVYGVNGFDIASLSDAILPITQGSKATPDIMMNAFLLLDNHISEAREGTTEAALTSDPSKEIYNKFLPKGDADANKTATDGYLTALGELSTAVDTTLSDNSGFLGIDSQIGQKKVNNDIRSSLDSLYEFKSNGDIWNELFGSNYTALKGQTGSEVNVSTVDTAAIYEVDWPKEYLLGTDTDKVDFSSFDFGTLEGVSKFFKERARVAVSLIVEALNPGEVWESDLPKINNNLEKEAHNKRLQILERVKKLLNRSTTSDSFITDLKSKMNSLITKVNSDFNLGLTAF